jgi:hypothetical protein
MTEKTDLNVSPYYDDFSEDKNFHKVLYRSGRALQSRELIQSQSILQNQIERFGDHMFKEGSIVQGCQSGLDLDIYFVRVKSTNPNSEGDTNSETYRTASVKKYYQGKTSGVVAQVITTTAETSDDALTLFVKYVRQGTDTGNSFTFTPSEEIQEVTLGADGAVGVVTSNKNEYELKAKTDAEDPNGLASLANIKEGIIFVRGFFIKIPEQELLLEKYSGAPSYRIGLTITESLISSTTDTSLLDNSQGTSNENSTGADRLKIDLTLSKYSLTTTDDTDFVELIRVNKGIIEIAINKPIYGAIENTMARRTFDANGDFVTQQFTHSLREHLDDTTNRGFYTKVNGGVEDKFVLQMSPGKAYVKGYEIDKIGTSTVSFNKARNTTTLSNANTPIRIGNFLKIKNTHSLPEFGNESGEETIVPHKSLELWDSAITSAGTKPTSGQIGVTRLRNVDLDAGTDSSGVYADSSIFQLYVFDIKMFTKITGTTSVANFLAGDKVVGSVSGATGIVANQVASGGASILVHDVVGTFTAADAISAVGAADTAVIANVTAVRTYNVDRARSITQTPNQGANEIFTADLVADQDNTLTGSCSINTTALTGFGTKFTTELKEGDIVIDGGGTERIVASITTDLAAVIASGTAMTQANCTRRRVRIFKQDQTSAISSWPRDFVKTHSADLIQVRRQKTVKIGSGGFSITVTGGTFAARNTDNFTMAVIEPKAGGSLNAGDVLDIEDFTTNVTTSGSNQTLTFSGINTNNNDAVLKVTFTANIVDPVARTKNLRNARCLQVSKERTHADGPFFGTAYDDEEITLGVADAFKIRGIYEATGGATTPLPPSATFTVSSGSFVNYETVIGQTSNAHAVIISTGGTTYFYYISGTLVNTESVVGQTSNAIATLSNVTAGGQDIKNRYFFDNGQRDGYYDLSKLVLKTGSPKPSNKILIVFDYFTPSGAGDYFDVNSYSAIEYKDIPVYSPSRVDLGGLEPDGTYELSDAIDFRPVVGQVIGTTTFGSNNAQNLTSPVDLSNTTSGAVYAPFGYNTGRSFEGSRTGITATNANTVDTPVSGSSFVGDISFFVGRFDKVFLHKTGKLQVSQGEASLSPTKPKAVDDSIELFELYIPPFTRSLKNVKVRSKDHRRFTMGDISRINNRVTNLERITSLSLLERDTQTMQILDGDGFDRFKSGFLVDNFRGHRVGDVNHPDYECSIDVKSGSMRPQSYSQFLDISLNTARSTNIKQTGNLITLPYTESTFVNANKASRTSNVNPYNVFSFQGTLKLTPGTDIWQDTTQLPEVRINREGNFDSIQSTVENSLGTVWNSWQTTWVGEPSTVSEEVQSTSNGSWSGDPTQGGVWQAGEEVTREITETVETQTRTGVTTSVVEDFVETRGDRIVSVTLIPFCRARTVELDGENLKPNTNHYFFFDNIRVDKFVRPYNANYSQDSGTTVTSDLKTDGQGRLRGYFELPNSDEQRFATGMREMRATASYHNLPNPASSCSDVYQAQGLLQASQTEITSTRNGRVVYEQLTGERDITTRGENTNTRAVDEDAPPIPVDQTPPPPDPITNEPPEPPRSSETDGRATEFDLWLPDFWENERELRGWRDPLAQSFLVESSGGMFMSSIDVYFAKKDTTMPVSVEIRTMHNGYPANLVMPFSTVTKNPADVNTTTDGSTATNFAFESPVYLDDGVEYCFVVYTNSSEYECFVSRMGEKDLATGQTIAEQPYAGSLFKSQNNSTWTAEQTDDLKFHLKRCQFDTTKVPYVSFDNAALDTQILQENPIQTFSGQNYVKVYSYTHGMYHAGSNTTIANVTGDATGSVLTMTATPSGTPAVGNYNGVAVTGGSGTGMTVDIAVTSGPTVAVTIANPGSNYTAGNTVVVNNYNGTADLSIAVNTVGDTLGGMPVDAINESFTALLHIGIDTFCVTPSLSAYNFKTGYTATSSTLGGGKTATATRDYYFDTLHTMIPSIAMQGTKITAAVKTTPMYSPEGFISGTVYTQNTTSTAVTLNDNSWMSAPSIVASPLNEANEMSNGKSFDVSLQLYSGNPNISPVIDVSSIGCLVIANRINNINSGSDVPTGTTYIPSTSPDGDNNAMTYITRKVSLKTPAQGLRVTADFFRPPTTDLKVLYKVLNNDDETPFDDLGWRYFNTTGAPDSSTEADSRNFKEYEFTVDDLNEFSAFSIKIVGQGTNTCAVPMVSALRCIAIG